MKEFFKPNKIILTFWMTWLILTYLGLRHPDTELGSFVSVLNFPAVIVQFFFYDSQNPIVVANLPFMISAIVWSYVVVTVIHRIIQMVIIFAKKRNV